MVEKAFVETIKKEFEIDEEMQKEVDRPTRLLQFVAFVHLPFSFRSVLTPGPAMIRTVCKYS